MAAPELPPGQPQPVPPNPWDLTLRGFDLVRAETQALVPGYFIAEWPRPLVGEPGGLLLGWWNIAMRFSAELQRVNAIGISPGFPIGPAGGPAALAQARVLVRATIEDLRPGSRLLPVPYPVRPLSPVVEISTYQVVSMRLLGELNALLAEYQARFGGLYF